MEKQDAWHALFSFNGQLTRQKYNDVRQHCVLVSTDMAGGRLFPVALAPDPVGL